MMVLEKSLAPRVVMVVDDGAAKIFRRVPDFGVTMTGTAKYTPLV